MKYNKVRISTDELTILYLPSRVSALEVAKKIRLPAKSNFKDRIDLDLTPYLKLPVSLIGKNAIKWMFIIAPTQSGKTVGLQIFVADTIDQDPGTLIYILPDETSGRKAVNDKIVEMIRATPELMEHIKSERDLNTSRIKLDNMYIYPGWSGSLATMSSIAAKRVVLDEIRLMKLMIGSESNAIKLANDRMTTYLDMGLGQGMGVSTPSVEGDLLHQQLTVPNTMVLMWATKCVNCGNVDILDFYKNVRPYEGKCICLKCGNAFEDADKKKLMNDNSFYLPVNVEKKNQIIKYETPTIFPERVVFWYDSLASPFRSFQAIYNEYMQTKGKRHDYKNFVQCWLARFWIDDISKTSSDKLEQLQVEEEGKGVVPSWTKVITAGIDTQDSGFYVVVRAWGKNRKSRVIDTYFIECRLNLSDAEDVERVIGRDVDDRIYRTKDGKDWKIALYGIDTGGHRTKQVYEGTRKFERIIWVKGARDVQKTTITYSKDYNLYLVRTVEYLEETEDKANSGLFELHNGIAKDYLLQFCNMRKTRKVNNNTGEESVLWKSIGQFDYRMADVHSFICMDIPTAYGTFRHEVEKEDFYVNPLHKKIEAEVAAQQDDFNDDEESEFEIDNFEEGW